MTISTVMCDAGCAKGARQAGFAAVQSIAMAVGVLLLLSAAAAAWNFGMGILRGRAAAQQLITVSEGAKQYARIKGLAQTLTPGDSAVAVTTDMLTDEGILLPSANSSLLVNGWNQHYIIYYYIPVSLSTASSKLTVAVLSYGGEKISERDVSIASMAGGSAGVVVALPDGDILRGVGGGYAFPLGKSPMNIPSPGPGHLGFYSSLDDAALLADTLYRVSVPGRPELNQMRVDLDLSGNSLVNTKSVKFDPVSVGVLDLSTICGAGAEEKTAAEGKVFFYTGAGGAGTADHELDGLYACRQGVPQQIADAGNSSLLRSARTVADGTAINAPSCPQGLSPFISVSPATLPTGMGYGDTLYSSYSGGGTVGDPWIVHLTRYDIAGNPLPTDGGSVSVITSCGR